MSNGVTDHGPVPNMNLFLKSFSLLAIDVGSMPPSSSSSSSSRLLAERRTGVVPVGLFARLDPPPLSPRSLTVARVPFRFLLVPENAATTGGTPFRLWPLGAGTYTKPSRIHDEMKGLNNKQKSKHEESEKPLVLLPLPGGDDNEVFFLGMGCALFDS